MTKQNELNETLAEQVHEAIKKCLATGESQSLFLETNKGNMVIVFASAESPKMQSREALAMSIANGMRPEGQ